MLAKISGLLTVSLLALSSAANADVEISGKPTANMSCDVGVCTATAAKAVLNTGDLQTMLANGDVAVKTGSLAKDIDIDQPLTWATTSRLTLDAQASVTIKKQVTVSGTGNLTIVTNDGGGKKGEFVIAPEHGSVQFWDLASSLIIDGNSYTLVGDIKTLAADIAADPSGFYALAKPYDASVDGIYSTSPIMTAYVGTFEGLGNAISNLAIKFNNNGESKIGMFEDIGSGGQLRNIRLSNANVAGFNAIGSAVGILAGNNEGEIVYGSVQGTVGVPQAETLSGGLVGYNAGSISNCTAKVLVDASSSIISYVGDLVGYNDGVIENSFANGAILLAKAGAPNAGGLVGYSAGRIENTFATTAIKDGRNCCEAYIGGLVGENESTGQIASSYAAGKIKHGTNNDALLGGLIGFDNASPGNVASAYWDLDEGISNPSQGAGNTPNDPGITGLTDAQLKSGLPYGFDPKVWGSNPNINNGYPYLLAQP